MNKSEISLHAHISQQHFNDVRTCTKNTFHAIHNHFYFAILSQSLAHIIDFNKRIGFHRLVWPQTIRLQFIFNPCIFFCTISLSTYVRMHHNNHLSHLQSIPMYYIYAICERSFPLWTWWIESNFSPSRIHSRGSIAMRSRENDFFLRIKSIEAVDIG